MSKPTQNWYRVYLRAADQAQADPALTAHKAYVIVSPNLLKYDARQLDGQTIWRLSCAL